MWHSIFHPQIAQMTQIQYSCALFSLLSAWEEKIRVICVICG